jgi:hypothetical protein
MAMNNAVQQLDVTIYTLINKIKLSENFSASVALDSFQGLNSHMWLIATLLDSISREHLQHHQTFHWTVLV